MPLSPGSRIGTYEIISALGAGGMGEVYRARDSKLKREIAIKVLPPDVANDRDRLARFQREAEVLASLNHPHIAQIYGIEGDALVMELVEGEDLSQRIARGPIPFDDALPIARQIIDALECAHDAGVVHRDLKPANIKLRSDGTVKILDFGLAKAVESAESPGSAAQAATITSPAMTMHGMILGTAAYMSPEQAKGKPVDKRADIWAFGSVLYEMLAGKKAFAGEDITDTIVAVMSTPPDWSQLPADTPAGVRRLLTRCLDKDARRRLRDIGDARLDLDPAADVAPQAPVRVRRGSVMLTAIIALAAVVAATALGVWWQGSRTTDGAWTATPLGGPRIAFQPRVSPDGRMVSFIALIDGQSQLAVLNTGTADWSILTTDRTGPVVYQSWSPDGTRLYFDRRGSTTAEIYSVSALGGEPRLVLDNARIPEALSDGSVLFVRNNDRGHTQLHRFHPGTGAIDALPMEINDSLTPAIRAFADGREVVVFGRLADAGQDEGYHLYALDLKSLRARTLGGAAMARPGFDVTRPVGVSHDGKTVFTALIRGNSSTVMAIPRDGSGPAHPLFATTRVVVGIDDDSAGNLFIDQVDRSIEHVRFAISGGTPEVLAAGLSDAGEHIGTVTLPDGRTVYTAVAGARRTLMISRPGEELVPFVVTPEDARGPLVMLGSEQFAFVSGTNDQSVVTLASSRTGRISHRLEGTRGREIIRMAASPDGATLYFVADAQIWSIPAAGGDARLVTAGQSLAVDPQNRFLIVQRSGADRVSLFRRDRDGTETVVPLPAGTVLVRNSLWPGSLDSNGRLLIAEETGDSWFWRPAILDPATGRMVHIPTTYQADVEQDLTWHGDHFTALARRMASTLWRFEQARD